MEWNHCILPESNLYNDKLFSIYKATYFYVQHCVKPGVRRLHKSKAQILVMNGDYDDIYLSEDRHRQGLAHIGLGSQQ